MLLENNIVILQPPDIFYSAVISKLTTWICTFQSLNLLLRWSIYCSVNYSIQNSNQYKYISSQIMIKVYITLFYYLIIAEVSGDVILIVGTRAYITLYNQNTLILRLTSLENMRTISVRYPYYESYRN